MKSDLVAICGNLSDLPEPTLPEIAVAGRSNCGKSTLLNSLLMRRLARTSGTPGRTQQIFICRVEPKDSPPFHLVDLPGFGFAKTSRQKQRDWNAMVTHYVETRSTLIGFLLLADIRRGAEEDELNLVEWAAQRDLFVRVVLTKADKVSKNARFGALQAARRYLKMKEVPLPASVKMQETINAVRDDLVKRVRQHVE